MTFQQLILALSSYWSQQGCVLGQPYDTEKGAGTFNPHTFLRSLGPEPWNVAYVEPCRRPADGRYGDNPNRLGAYYQFQVILKPSPTDVLAKYLRGLTALGIRPHEHDIRFVEDDWESPTVGAWGLGWEVWLDGMEITQFTYFQQVGGVECKPVSAEITYGLERIAMYLQGVDNVYDLEWGHGFKYGEIHHQTEVEWSKYNFEEADVDQLFRSFTDFEDQAKALADKGLVFPAYDFAMKCSHLFNTLDARGAISVAERAAYIGRIRNLSKTCAETWVEERSKLGWPILKRTASTPAFEESVDDTLTLPLADAGLQTLTEAHAPALAPTELLIEVGTEELPARFLVGGERALRDGVLRFLDAQGVAHGPARVYATPRRLVLVVDDVEPVSARKEELETGPPVRAAFDADGAPKIPAIKFAERHGVAVEDLLRVEKGTGKKAGEYVAVKTVSGNEPTVTLLENELPAILRAIPWPKSMRWSDLDERFARPIHWYVALLGGQKINFSFAGVTSGDRSRGHRFFGNEQFAVQDFASLQAGLAERNVVLSGSARRSMIEEQLDAAAAALGGTAVKSEGLLNQVVGLVETPRVVTGSFDERYLALPRPVITSILDYHQKMFPVVADGTVLPNFLGVSNNPTPEQPKVREGYERVVSARLADGEFFHVQDRKKPLADWGAGLSGRTFLRGAGTMADKAGRIASLSGAIAAKVGVDVALATRAGQLAKADLATHLVGEFPELQGVIGRIYASEDGEDAGIAAAIDEHYQPKGVDDDLPASDLGTVVALADKLDSLAVLFGLGKIPTGSADPYALRRAALGIVRILLARDLSLTLGGLCSLAIDAVPDEYLKKGRTKDQTQSDLLDFFRGRLKAAWTGEGFGADFVEAVLGDAIGDLDLRDARARLEAVKGAAGSDGFTDLMVAFKRIANIVRKARDAGETIAAGPTTEDAEAALVSAYSGIAEQARPAIASGDYVTALAAMATLRAPLAAFFDDVMVMAEDPAVRAARLHILASIGDELARVADFSRISTER